LRTPTGTHLQPLPAEAEGDVPANVHEIYPGAARQAPLRRSSRSKPWRLQQPRRQQILQQPSEEAFTGHRHWPSGSELGMATAEYAIATLAAVGFAGLLVVILKSDEVRGFLLGIIRSALSLQ
jgi:Protein of unknown function (DUF4244)